jgi:hypothetical protein
MRNVGSTERFVRIGIGVDADWLVHGSRPRRGRWEITEKLGGRDG